MRVSGSILYRERKTTTLLESAKGKRMAVENYFMINLHESMGPGWDQTGVIFQGIICLSQGVEFRLHSQSKIASFFPNSMSVFPN